MKNENIGELGRAFIAQRTDAGIDFGIAWDEWQHIQRKLKFIITYPEVLYYDDRRIADSQERQRLRDLAKSELGDHIRSSDVSMLGRIAAWLDIEVPVRPYHMDRHVVAEWLTQQTESLELEHGMDETVAEFRQAACSHTVIEEVAESMEQFAVAHSLSAVPPVRLIGMYCRHVQRLSATSFSCISCKEEITFPVDQSAGEWQQLRVACPKCHCWNKAYMSIDCGGEANVMCVFRDNEAGDNH